MSVASAAPPPAPVAPAETYQTFADVLRRLGNVPPHRVRLNPPPGTATEQDVATIFEYEQRRFELVDGVLVEKVMGYEESQLAALLVYHLIDFVRRHDIGKVAGEAGATRLFPGLVRIPDASFVSWARYPKGKRKRGAIPNLVPDLAVEVLSKGNTRGEMARKLHDYFEAGVRLVWYVDPKKRTVQVFTAVDRSVTLRADQTLDGGDVLPGFTLAIREWFAEAERQGPKGK